VTTHRLDVAKLARDVDRARRAGAPDEISYREVARRIGVGPSMFTRINDGFCPDVDNLLSLLMWLNPDATVGQYTLAGDRRNARARAPRRRGFATVSPPAS
jgi:hypothetical protein